MIARWPYIAGVFFWLGALDQVREIVTAGSAEDVSLLAWAGACVALLGYVAFYSRLAPSRERTNAVIASWVSATLYAVLSALIIFVRYT